MVLSSPDPSGSAAPFTRENPTCFFSPDRPLRPQTPRKGQWHSRWGGFLADTKSLSKELTVPGIVQRSSADCCQDTPLNTSAQNGGWLAAAAWTIRRTCVGCRAELLPGHRPPWSHSPGSTSFHKTARHRDGEKHTHKEKDITGRLSGEDRPAVTGTFMLSHRAR